jgi:NAD(P)-dependent dehydrogenase (short-subunit alcohol dehydrogenase family)
MQELNGKVAIITGAASGIGKAITTAFINENCFVVAADQSRERLTQLATIELSNVSSQAITCVTDMSNEDEIEHMISMALKQFGKLDILVNNAGIMDHFEPVAEVSNLRWEQVMKVNLEGPLKAMRSACRVFLQQKKGVILNIASIGGLFGTRAGAAYTASKHGLVGLTKNTGYYYAKDGIRCNAIAPGGVPTHILEGFDMESLPAKTKERIIAGTQTNPRFGTPEEIANVAVFLASEKSSFVNGAIVTVDGGWTAY